MTNHAQWMVFHHDWEIVAVKERFQPFLDPMTRELYKTCGTFWTDVLYRCACGKLKTKKIQGQWTLEQVRGDKEE